MRSIILSTAAAAALLMGCTNNTAPKLDLPKVEIPAELAGNSLLGDWSGDYGGVPNFEKAQLSDLKPALEYGMTRSLAEIDAIAGNTAAPSFDNTIVALERTGADLDRIFSFWGIWSSNMSSPEFRAIQGEMSPKLSEFSSKITQNEKLFARVKAVYDGRAKAGLRPDQLRLTELVYDGFARDGATLNAQDKARYAAIDKRLSALYTDFGNNVLHDEENYVTFLSKAQLGGLPDSFVKAAAAAAKSRDKAGEYAITNTRSSMSPFLTYSTERSLRKTVWSNYYARGDNGGEFDNNAIIAEILKLRGERVGLLGYDNYAQWRLENRMAGTPERALELMEAVWPAATARAREEVADMQALATSEGAKIKIAPWDYRFYAEKVRKDRYDLDSDEVKAYLQLDKLREGMFYVAGELFNFKFTPVAKGKVPVFHPDVKVWEVADKTTGDFIGLWYLDPFARKGKRSGAWATSYRSHTTFDGPKTVLASNNSNFVKAPEGEAVLVSWDDATTFFHEFGHALHGLSSNVAYPTLNGGVRDYTEFQSQLLERWVSTPEVINQFLTHYKTGEPMPEALFAKIQKAATFNQGFATTEYLASALMDMRYHTTDPSDIDPDKFERETMAALGLPEEIVMRHRSPHFSHVFSGEGYSAGYYGYMWADVLTSDAAEAFKEAPGGFYDKAVAKKLVNNLFAPRNSVDPKQAYHAFRGKNADIAPLMRDRGFPIPKK